MKISNKEDKHRGDPALRIYGSRIRGFYHRPDRIHASAPRLLGHPPNPARAVPVPAASFLYPSSHHSTRPEGSTLGYTGAYRKRGEPYMAGRRDSLTHPQSYVRDIGRRAWSNRSGKV